MTPKRTSEEAERLKALRREMRSLSPAVKKLHRDIKRYTKGGPTWRQIIERAALIAKALGR